MDDNIQSKNTKRRLESDAPRGAADAAMATERLRKAAYNQEDSPTEHSESSEQRTISQRVSDGIFSIGQAIKHVFVSDSEPAKQATSSEKTRNDIPSLKIDNAKSEFSGNAATAQNAQASEKSDPSALRGQASTERQQISLLDSIKSGHIEGLGNCDVPAGTRPESWNSFSAPQTKTQEAPKQNLFDTIKSGNIEGLGNCDAPANATQVWQDQMRKMESASSAAPPVNAVDFKRNVIDSANEQSAKVLDRSNSTQTASQQADSTKGNGVWDALKSDDMKGVGDCELKPGASLPTFVPKSDAKPDPNQNMIMKPASMPAFKQGESNPGNDISANAAARKANDGSSGTNYAQGDASKYQAADPNSYSGLARGGDNSARTMSATDGGRVFNSDPRVASSDSARNFGVDGRTSFDARTGSDTRIGSDQKFAGIGSDNSSSRDFSRTTSDGRGSIDFASSRYFDAGRIDSSPSFRRTDSDQQALASHSDSRQRSTLDFANEPRRIAESDAARSESKASSIIDNEKLRSLQTTNTAEQIPQRGQVAEINTTRRDESQSTIAVDRNAQSNRNSFDSNIPFMAVKGSSSLSAEAATQAVLATNVFRMQNLDRASTGVNLIAGDQKSVVNIDKIQPLTVSSLAVSDRSATASIIMSDRSISITTDKSPGAGVVASSTSTGGSFFDSGKFVRGEEAAAAAGRKDAGGLTNSAIQDKQVHAIENGSAVKSTLISDASGRIADLKATQKAESGAKPFDKSDLADDGSRTGKIIAGQNNGALVVKVAGLDSNISINKGELLLTDGDAILNHLPGRNGLNSSDKRYLTGVEITVAAILTLSGAAKLRDERAQVLDADAAAETSNQPQVKILQRRTHMVNSGQTLISIAEELYHNSAVAWLIADLNRTNIKDEWIEGKRVVELKSRQILELPEGQEVAMFMARLPRDFEASKLITVLSDSTVDRELLDSYLGTISGAPVTEATRVAEPARIEFEHKLPELSIAMEEEDGLLDEPPLTNIVKDLSSRVGRLLKRPHGKLGAAT